MNTDEQQLRRKPYDPTKAIPIAPLNPHYCSELYHRMYEKEVTVEIDEVSGCQVLVFGEVK